MYPVTSSILTNLDPNLDWIKTQAGRLTTTEISPNDKENIIGILLRIPIEKVEFVVNETLRFSNYNDYNVPILDTLSNLSYESNSDIKFLVDQTLKLLNTMSNDESD